MDKIDAIWDEAEQGVPKLGDAVMFRGLKVDGDESTRAYEVYFQQEPVPEFSYPDNVRIIKRA